MINENLKIKNDKDCIKENIVPIIFAVVSLIGLFLTKQTPLSIMNELIQGFIGNAFLVLALLIPVMAGMGFNFSIGVGAIAGQIGIIMVVNWGLSGFVGLLAAVAFATPLAILFGILAGVVLNKARGYEMIASLFVGYLGNGIYNFVLLYLMGTVIPITSSLLLAKGSGLINHIDLNHTLGHSIDGLLQAPFFFLLIVAGLILLALSIYPMKKDTINYNKTRVNSRIILSIAVIIISALIMYIDVLTKVISDLKDVEFPLITGLLIGLLAAFHLLITRTKMGQAFLEVGLNQKNSNYSESHVSKVRISAIIFSTVLASWGQIIFLQNTGFLSTYSSHMSVGLPTILALIVGGASINKATVKHALLGIILVQSFLIIGKTASNGFEIARVIIFNSVFLYAFAMSRSKKYNSERL
jgi:simple sugar transport system permease protein